MIIIDKLSYSSGLADVSPEEKFAYAVLTPDISAVEYTGNPGQCIQRAAGCLCNPGGAVLCDIQLDGAEKRRADDTDCACKCFQSVCPVF